MRILILLQNPQIVGGIETHLSYLAPALVERGYSIAFGIGAQLDGNIRDQNYLSNFPHWPASDLQRSREWKPDVVYSHGIRDRTLECEYQSVFPCVFFAHGYHGACVSGTRLHTRPQLRVCDRQFGLGCLIAYLPCGCGGINPFTAISLYRNQTQIASRLHNYKTICVASRHMHDLYSRQLRSETPVSVLPLFPAGHIPLANEPSKRALSYRLLLATRFTKVKGVHLVPEAVAITEGLLGHSIELVVAGDGPEKAAFLSACVQNKVRVVDHGWLDTKSLGDILKYVDMQVVPSVWPEPFGLVGIEAACYGVPSVAFPVGGIVDWLVDNESGILAALPPSSHRLSDAIYRGLANPDDWQRLRVGAWNMSQGFTIDKHIKLLIDKLQQATNRLI